MRKFAVILVLLPLLAFAVPQTRKIRQITLRREPCYGTCPIYEVTINSDGKVTYKGERFVTRVGTYTATIWPGYLDDLSAMLDKLGFWKMKDKYTVQVTDQPSQIVTVLTDKGKKTINEYGHSGPKELWAIQTMIDGLIENASDWRKVK